MKIGFIIACHNKVDDLVAHLEIFKYYPYPHQVIVIHTMDYNKEYMDDISKHHNKRINGYGHHIGPLLSAIEGVRVAHDLGLDYAVYRNSDDWLFSYDFELTNFHKMEKHGYLCGGYNWLNVGVDHDITLNQVYFHVPSFYKTAADAENYFKRSQTIVQKGYLCEYKMARWVKRTCNMKTQFLRLAEREQEPGIGWERKDIPLAFKSKGLPIPPGFWKNLENNNRFFNFNWQMIGSHNVGARLNYWRKIRSLVPYGREIEKEKHFARFIDAARNNKPWNIPEEKKVVQEKIETLHKPKVLSRKIF